MAVFEKILETEPMTRSSNLGILEPTIQLLHPSAGIPGLSEKIASEAAEWAKSIKPVEGKTYILVLALGASEYYGPNRNGDAFKEKELKKSHKTFEDNAHVFKSHVNKDPAKKLGDVVKSFYNERMHRVELILEIDNSKAPEVARNVREQKDVAVSMGCRIKFDVCSICGNEAPNRAKYCKHLKHELGDIYPDGRIVCADNPNPNFFDISVVWRPADKTGYMLKKVARLAPGLDTEYSGTSGAELAEKVAGLTVLAEALQKAADIEKQVEGVGTEVSNLKNPETSRNLHRKWLAAVAPKALKEFKEIAPEDIDKLAQHDLPEVLATLTSMGIYLTTPEFLELTFKKLTGKPPPQGLAETIVSNQAELFSLLAKRPDIIASVLESGAISVPGGGKTNSSVADKMAKYESSRSLKDSWIAKRAYSMPLEVGYTDPSTGAQYRSTRSEIGRAGKVKKVNEAASLVGATALGLVAYKALNALMGVRGALGKVMSLLGAGVAGGATYNTLIGDTTPRVTDEGIPIPPQALFRQTSPGIPRPPLSAKSPGARPPDAPDGSGSWVLPTMLLADKYLLGGSGVAKSASIKLPSELDSDSIDFNVYSKKLGEALLNSP